MPKFMTFERRTAMCWQPNALVRVWETDDKLSEKQSNRESFAPSTMTEVAYSTKAPIRALAIQGDGVNYAVGDGNGSVRYFSSNGEEIRQLAAVFMVATHLSWSDDGCFIAFADLARRITVKEIEPLEATIENKPILLGSENDQIKQILLSHNGDFVLIASPYFANLWSVTNKAIVSPRPQNDTYLWANHPTDHSKLLGFGSYRIQMTGWSAEDSEIPCD